MKYLKLFEGKDNSEELVMIMIDCLSDIFDEYNIHNCYQILRSMPADVSILYIEPLKYKRLNFKEFKNENEIFNKIRSEIPFMEKMIGCKISVSIGLESIQLCPITK